MEYAVYATEDCLQSSHPQQSMLIVRAVTAAIFLPAARRAELSANELPGNASAVHSWSWLLSRARHSISSSYMSIFVTDPLVSFSCPRWIHTTFMDFFSLVRWDLWSTMWCLIFQWLSRLGSQPAWVLLEYTFRRYCENLVCSI